MIFASVGLIMDLRALNKNLRKYKFKIITVAALVCTIRRGIWFAAVNLKHAYFHISIYPAHRKYLRFSFQSGVQICFSSNRAQPSSMRVQQMHRGSFKRVSEYLLILAII